MTEVIRQRTLAAGVVGAVLVLAACGSNGGGNATGSQAASSHAAASHAAASHAAASPTTGTRLPAENHSQLARTIVRDCEATVVSLARGTGAATPTRYQSTVDHLAAELSGLAGRDGNSQEAAALSAEASGLSKYAADIGALPNAEYQHSTTYLSQQPLKGDLNRAIAESQLLKQRYGIVCISPGG